MSRPSRSIRPCRRVLLLAIVAAVLLGPAEAVASKWTRLRFQDITVIANTSEREAAGLARQIGRLRRSLRSYDMVENVQERPVYLYLFKNRDSFEPYLPLKNGKPAWLGGYTTSSLAGVFMALDITAADHPMEVVYHEYVHAYLRAHAPRTPLWLEEGLAEFYGAFRMEGDTAVIGEPVEHHVKLLSGSRPMERARLLTIEPGDPEYNEGLRQSFFYAQSWANVHYLLTDKTRRTALHSFLERIHAGERAMPTLMATLGDVLPDQETELIDYATQRKLPYFRIERKSDDASLEYGKEDIDEADIYASLGLLLMHLTEDRPGAAEAYFLESLSKNPQQLDARMGLAMLRSVENQPERAKKELAAIIEDHPDHAAARILMARELNREYLTSDEARSYWARTETPPALAEARAHAQAALELQPDDGEALAQYGVSFYADKDPSEGIAALERASQIVPWEVFFSEGLVELHCHAGNVEAARTIYDRDVVPRTRPAEREAISALLVDTELKTAARLEEDGDLEGALLVLVRAAEGTGDRRQRQLIQRAWGSMTASAEVQRLNEAIEIYTNGDPEGALTALDALIPGLKYDSVRKHAEELRETIRAELGK